MHKINTSAARSSTSVVSNEGSCECSDPCWAIQPRFPLPYPRFLQAHLVRLLAAMLLIEQLYS